MQKTKIDYIHWRNRLEEFSSFDMRIGTDVILVKDGFNNIKEIPFRIDVTTCIIYIKGWARFRINMKEFLAKAPCMVVLPYDAIIETLEISQDVMTRVIVMSREFTNNLFHTQENMSHLHRDIINNPIIDLTGNEDALITYYKMLKNIIYYSDSPYRLETAKHLTLAIFYAFTKTKHTTSNRGKLDRKDELYDEFIALVSRHYRTEHDVGFYAEKLCITPKYLSRAIKDASGRSALEWIEEYTITESKALLYSTNQSIQEIAYSLGFQSQSLFGKYFKRVVGISPRDYRKSIGLSVDNKKNWKSNSFHYICKLENF